MQHNTKFNALKSMAENKIITKSLPSFSYVSDAEQTSIIDQGVTCSIFYEQTLYMKGRIC